MRLNYLALQNAAVCYVCIWAVSPFLAYGEVFRLLVLVAVACWVTAEVCRAGNIFTRPTLPVMLSAFYITYSILIELLGPGERNFDWHLQSWIMLFFLVVYESRRREPLSLAPVFWLLLMIIPVGMFTTLAELQVNPHAARVIVRSTDYARELAERGVGGYSLVYATVFLLPILLALMPKAGGLVSREAFPLSGLAPLSAFLLIAVNTILGFMLVLQAQFSIAVILSLFSMLMLVLGHYQFIRLAMVTIPMIMVLTFLSEPLLVWILETVRPYAPGQNYVIKINDILHSLQLEQATGAVNDRTERYLRSFYLFLENPLLGDMDFSNIGKHSSYLDRFARYGFFVGGIFVYLMVYLPFRLLNEAAGGTSMAAALLFLAVIFPAVNNVFMALGVMLFIIFPVAHALLVSLRLSKTQQPLPVNGAIRNV